MLIKTTQDAEVRVATAAAIAWLESSDGRRTVGQGAAMGPKDLELIDLLTTADLSISTFALKDADVEITVRLGMKHGNWLLPLSWRDSDFVVLGVWAQSGSRDS